MNKKLLFSRKFVKVRRTLWIAAALFIIANTVEAENVSIGALMPMTGSLAEYGTTSLNGIKLAVQQVNEGGGLLNGQMKVVVGDTQTNPQAGVAAAKQLVSVNQVVGIVGAISSGVTIPVASSVTSVAGIPQISPASTAPAITALQDKDFLFRTVPHDMLQGEVLGDVVKEKGYGKVAVIYVNNDYGKGLADAFAGRFRKTGGVVTALSSYEEKQASYRGELSLASADKPEALVLIGYPGDGIPIVKQAIEEGYFTKFVFTDGMKSTDMIKAIGSKFLKDAIGTAPEAVESDSARLLRDAYQAAYGEVPPLPFIDTSYDASFLLALAIQKAGSTDGDKVRNALRQVAKPPGDPIQPGEWKKAVKLLGNGKDIDYVGAAGSQNFDQAGDVPGTFGVWVIKGGTIKTQRIIEPKTGG